MKTTRTTQYGVQSQDGTTGVWVLSGRWYSLRRQAIEYFDLCRRAYPAGKHRAVRMCTELKVIRAL